ncbi:glycoside hydrolase family protein [Novosphingobium sp. MBES04]|nr:glycoside hydrolase family protein [Novosphingobium sp. MBES04]
MLDVKTNTLAGLAPIVLGVPLVLGVGPVQARAPGPGMQLGADAGLHASGRAVTQLATGWRFRKASELDTSADPSSPDFDASGWAAVAVPHTWNRIGTYEAAAGVPGAVNRELDDYRGVGWYRLELPARALAPGRRAWLEFDAASRTADVWLNGVHLGRHEGGFSRFRFEATAALRAEGPNVLTVKVDNTDPAPGNATANTLPLAGDFFVQGGLYRPVRLIETADAHFAMRDFGGPGVYAQTTAIADDRARIEVLARLSNARADRAKAALELELRDRAGKLDARVRRPLELAVGEGQEVRAALDVADPHLWQGVEDPYLYTLVARLRDGAGNVLDTVEQDFGIRQFAIDPDKGFLINGRPVRLQGVGLHQDTMAHGWALTRADVARQIDTIRDMGANTVRLTHYQHGQPVHELADKYGLVVWDEIALVTAWSLDPEAGPAPAGIVANARQQLTELIRQNYNHASVAVWGVANEVDFGPNRPEFLGRGNSADPADPTPLVEELVSLAQAEDPLRAPTLATCCEGTGMPKVPEVADAVPVSAGNRYFGWYYGKPAFVGGHFDALHAARPDQPQAISEYGAGAAFSIHTDNPQGGPHDMGGRDQPEEYASWVHEQTWPELAKRPYLWGRWLWNSFDFATVTRKEGDSTDINTKGLVSYDGAIRKDAFYYYRAQWSDAPTVHVTGRRYRQRAYPVTDVRVYSNAPSVTLRVNGEDLGAKGDCPNRVCVWPGVRLASGANRIEATGHFADAAGGTQDVTDAIDWQLDTSRAHAFFIDAGALVASSGYGSDAFFKGGEAGTADTPRRGRPPLRAEIAPAEQRDALARFRKGDFTYHLPLTRGHYRVTLRFIEPEAAPGERRFDVSANAARVLSSLDIAAEAGATNRLLARSFEVDVAGEGLDLAFTPSAGATKPEALVSTIEVERAR